MRSLKSKELALGQRPVTTTKEMQARLIAFVVCTSSSLGLDRGMLWIPKHKLSIQLSGSRAA